MYGQFVSSTAGLPDLTWAAWFEPYGDFTMTDTLPWPGRQVDRVLPGSWRSRKGRVDGEGRDVWKGGGKERVGQINKGILSGLRSLPLSFSLSVSVSVSCSGPLLLSQADFIARPWTWAKQANSMTVRLISMSVSAHACEWQPESALQAWKPHSHRILFWCVSCLPLSHLRLSVFSFYHTDYFSINWLSLSFRSVSDHRPQGSVLYDVQW